MVICGRIAGLVKILQE